MCKCACVCVCLWMRTCVYVCLYVSMCPCISLCVYACTYVHICICVHDISLELKQIFDSLGYSLSHVTIRMKICGYTTNDFGVVILAYLVNIYIFKAILVIQ